tara:strand:- start:323 stop:490 length:168 start_codon:yes stop_codon:yes gene_type:complete
MSCTGFFTAPLANCGQGIFKAIDLGLHGFGIDDEVSAFAINLSFDNRHNFSSIRN